MEDVWIGETDGPPVDFDRLDPGRRKEGVNAPEADQGEGGIRVYRIDFLEALLTQLNGDADREARAVLALREAL